MTFLELVQKRHSCRNYADKAVSQEAIKRCLEAARLAPSACNSQPWHFKVVMDPQTRRDLAQKAFAGIYRMNGFAMDAPVLVVVIRERSKYTAALGAAFRGTQFGLIDLGIACEHFVLQAQEEGLGTCWIGWFDERAVKKVLCLPRHSKIDIILSLGYPQSLLEIEKDRKLITEISDFW